MEKLFRENKTSHLFKKKTAKDFHSPALYHTQLLMKFESLVTSKSVIMTLIAMTKSPRSPSSLFTPMTSSVMGFEKVLVGIPWKKIKNGFRPTYSKSKLRTVQLTQKLKLKLKPSFKENLTLIKNVFVHILSLTE